MMQKTKKRYKPLIIIVTASVLLLLYLFYMWDILGYFDNPGANALFGLLAYFFCFVYALISFITVVHLIKNLRTFKYFSLIHMGIITLTILLITWIPFTGGYQKLWFSLERDHLTETIQMYESYTLPPVGTDEYTVPYRLSSYTGKVYLHKNNDVIRGVFTIYRGFTGSSILLYISSDDTVNDSDYSFYLYGDKLAHIRKLDTGWYAAIAEN